jgi:Raf kinase inhibitor-like YbhB/YbcL family protein
MLQVSSLAGDNDVDAVSPSPNESNNAKGKRRAFVRESSHRKNYFIRNFRAVFRRSTGSLAAILLFFGSVPVTAEAQSVHAASAQPDWHGRFELHSSTFTNGSTLPQSTILNAAAVDGGTPVPGCAGGNESPQLSWTNAPRGTRSFAIILFDYDASFVHWAIYNIPASRTNLPQNAGIAKSGYGQQVFDDFVAEGLVSVADYNGPCPPPQGFAHRYVFTIYALDDFVTLSAPSQLTSIGDKLPTGETLFDALLHGRYHILASASIIGLYGIPAPASAKAVLRRRSH